MQNRSIESNAAVRRGYAVLGIIVVGIVCLPLILEAVWAVPDGDDFNNMCLMKNYLDMGYGYLLASVRTSYDVYLEWQGTYTGDLFCFFFSPFLRGGMVGYSVFCVLNVMFFESALFMSLKLIMKSFYCDIHTGLFFLLSVGTLYFAIYFSDPSELFYWFTAACVYTIPFALGMLGIAFLFHGIQTENKKAKIAAAVLGFLACGGSLQITGFVIWIYVVAFVYKLLEKNVKKNDVAVLLIVLLGTLLNVLAPGNFERKAQDSNGTFDIWKACGDTFSILWVVIRRMIHSSVFWLFVVFFIGIGMAVCITKELEKGKLLWLLVIFGGALFASTYPVCLGYGIATIHGRTEFVLYLCLAIAVALIFLLLGSKLPQIIKKYSGFMVVLGLLGISIITIWGGNSSLRECYTELMSGEPQLSYKNWKNIYAIVEQSDQNIVEIQMENRFISDLLVKNTYASIGDDLLLSPSYIAYTGKEDIIIEWKE